MSRVTAAQRSQALGIRNAYVLTMRYSNETGLTGVYLSYRTAQKGRWFRSAAWQVIRPGYRTDPEAHWTDHGHKTFDVFRPGDQKGTRLAEAQEWAGARYGVTEWVKIPGFPGDVFPAEIAAWYKALPLPAPKETDQ